MSKPANIPVPVPTKVEQAWPNVTAAAPSPVPSSESAVEKSPKKKISNIPDLQNSPSPKNLPAPPKLVAEKSLDIMVRAPPPEEEKKEIGTLSTIVNPNPPKTF